MSTFGDTLAAIDAHNHEVANYETWGHLAPKKNKTYRGRVVYAIGCFGSDRLNPTTLVSEWNGLDSSPWFYEALHDWLGEQENAEGCVYELIGSFRNYVFAGTRRLLIDGNKTI